MDVYCKLMLTKNFALLSVLFGHKECYFNVASNCYRYLLSKVMNFRRFKDAN